MSAVTRAVELAVRIGNRPGALARLFSIVSEQSINILAYCSYSERDQGVVHLVTEDPPRAQGAIESDGFKCKRDSVVMVSDIDRIGAAATLGKQLGKAGINILYSYASSGGGDHFYAVFKTDNDTQAILVLEAK